MSPARSFPRYSAPQQLRAAIRRGDFTGPTAGECPGFVQTNVVIVPAAAASDFTLFCMRNPQPCPLVARTKLGNPCPEIAAADGDLRTDVPRYRVFRDGVLDAHEPHDVTDLWTSDAVGFLLGCSFTFERALVAAGVPVRHLEVGSNVPMYRTSIPCEAAGPFAGPLVVSMRPVPVPLVETAIAVTGAYPTQHGAPLHIGDPAVIGITDLDRPDFGDAVPIYEGEVPLFWACGVTPQLALLEAKLPWAITHSPGCMFVTDLFEADLRR